MMRIVLFIIFIHASLFSQTDTNFIQQQPYNGTIYSYLNNKNNTIEYFNKTANYTLTYNPNSWGSFGIGASYKWVDVSLGLLSFGKLDENKYGTTIRTDFQFHLYPRKYIIDLFLQNYKGFYSINKEVLQPNQKALIRSDIGMNHIGLNFIRIINDKQYSTKAAYSLSEIQKRKAGTWAFGAKFNVFNVYSDSTLLNPSIDSLYQNDYKIKQFTSLLIGFLGGYLQNWVYKNWVFNITLMVGLANQLQYKELSSQLNKFYPHSTTGIILNVRLGAGYNHKRSFFYFYGITDNCNYPLSVNYFIKHSFGRIDFCYGYRLFKN